MLLLTSGRSLRGAGLPLGVLLLVLAPVSGQAQQTSTATPPHSVRDGAYTTEQAGRGEAVFREECGVCHSSAQFTGAGFLAAWNGARAYSLFDLIRTTMPYDAPGRLSRGAYADLLSYLFKLNGFPAGEQELPSDDDALKRIRIEAANRER